jgi:hypothetical protein
MHARSDNSLSRILRIACWVVISVCQVFAADPVVSRVQAKQREGSRMVDITYDVADPDSPKLRVYLKVSADGGATWKGPVELVSGDVGRGIVPGAGKRMVWDAGKEWPNQFGVNYRYRIGASDQWLAPVGMALIPGGAYPVNVSDFAIDRTEVTAAQWAEVRTWALSRGYDLLAGDSRGHNHPIHSVSWIDTIKWCNARSEKQGLVPAYYHDEAKTQVYRAGDEWGGVPFVNWNAGYRLPNEAEWEKAARGGVAGKLYPWGTDEISPRLVNYSLSNRSGTMPVGSYEANGYGLWDMAGNVREWCWEFVWGHLHVLRGGDWNNDAINARCDFRGTDYPNGGVDNRSGFRSVLPPGQP